MTAVITIVMVTSIDLYKTLSSLVDQIPEGRVSTPYLLAVSLGDPNATQAVSHVLKKEEFRKTHQKVVAKPDRDVNVFYNFSSEEPLKKLADLQLSMSKRVILEDRFNTAEKFAGVDAAYYNDEARAVCVVMDSDLRILETASAGSRVRFPYIPGYFMFREAPVIEAAAKRVSGFDVLFVNGHGVAHPRGCGLATCVGIELNVPTIGVAKKPLVGTVGKKRDSWTALIYKGRTVGAELGVCGCSPIYISVGSLISLETSVKISLKMVSYSYLPEPLRQAHIEARREIRYRC